MEIVNVKDYHLHFNGTLKTRKVTDMIVLHHTGGADIDASAPQIDRWHKNNGWAGIGYHYVIRKDGTVEKVALTGRLVLMPMVRTGILLVFTLVVTSVLQSLRRHRLSPRQCFWLTFAQTMVSRWMKTTS